MSKSFPQLSSSQETELVERLQQWSLANGLVMYPPNFKNYYSADVAPITLFPTPLPSLAFHRANEVQKDFNELYVNLVTKEKSWLLGILSQLSQFDKDFTGKLFETYEKAQKLGVKQDLSLGLFRSDYMVNEVAGSSPEIKQIEFNTVSVSFCGLSTKVGELHTYLNQSGSYDSKYSYPYYEDSELPVSDSINGMAKGLAGGNAAYLKSTGSKSASVLFIVQDGERNSFDQRHIEYQLLKNHGVKSFRVTLENAQNYLTVNSDKLYIKSSMEEISVVYYRAGYSPSDYESNPELTWASRLFLENSKAIKCPSVLTQLSGAKKIQQLLTSESILKKLLPKSDLSPLLSTFVNIYPLDDSEEGQKAKKLALESPENFVLKPQREGGGNNIYKEDIPTFLKLIKEEEWGAYILMELINPPSFKNTIIRGNDIIKEEIISELGVYGTILFNESTGDILENENAGFLLRSKVSSSNEGGVAAGFGCVDNVYLY